MFINSKNISTIELLPKRISVQRKAQACLLGLALLFGAGSCADPIQQINLEDLIGIDEEDIDDETAWYAENSEVYSPEELQICRETKAQLAALGINSLNRFKTLSEAQYIVRQRQRLGNNALDSSKPITVVLYAEHDPNGAFSWKWNSLGPILAKANQQVLFFEVRNDTECKAALRLLNDKLPVGQELVLILGGHGQQDYLTWSMPRSVIELDPLDYTDPGFKQLVQTLNIKLAIFESCKAGLGSGAEANQANRLAELIRIGGQVIAPLISIYRAAYVYDDAEKIIDVVYDRGEAGITYRAEGKYRE
ncbi:hypothetical protein NO1_0855 [Candidatus Termititenax aidoneus]|uniref:Uncharacterized protein n=1 Tax=Termititenax aidoneus TaxID=2218524 RepID=A0A388TCH8_TERA1|nr:hypothetical protein NO1_0855 [Candidatus Termititenax aidoneus]